MSPAARPATVRFYFDADLLGLAKVLVPLRPDITYPGDPGGIVHKRRRRPCVIADRATPDEMWIPEVARQGWLIVTRGSRIQERTAELDAVWAFGARMVGLASADAKTVRDQTDGAHAVQAPSAALPGERRDPPVPARRRTPRRTGSGPCSTPGRPS